MKTRMKLGLAAAAMLSLLSISASADTLLRILVVDTDDVAGYVQAVEKGQVLLKKAGSSGVVRLWQATFAGTDTGTVVVSVEYPDMITFAADNQRFQDNAELREWLAGLDKIRTIVSDSLYNEL